MSMSTQHGGGNRRPSATRPGAKPGDRAAKAASTEPDVDESTEVEDSAEIEAVDDDVDADGSSGTKPSGSSRSAAVKRGATKSAGSRSAAKSAGAGSTKSDGSSDGSSAGPRSSTKSAGAKSAGAKSAGPKSVGARPSSSRPATAAGGKGGGRRPIAPVKVNQGRNWGPIALSAAVGLAALLIIGFGAYQVYQNGRSWHDRANGISGLVDYKKKDKSLSKAGQHAWGPLKYPQSPPVGGTHNFNWQNCMGDVYDAPIASEHAVHSMEHGAVWVTYNPDKLSKADVDKLAKKVRGKEYMLMSPYPSLDKPISLQAWGYQLKLDSASDKRIDDFIGALRKNAGIEQGAVCSGGITETGTTPHDLGKDQPQQPQQPGTQPGG